MTNLHARTLLIGSVITFAVAIAIGSEKVAGMGCGVLSVWIASKLQDLYDKFNAPSFERK